MCGPTIVGVVINYSCTSIETLKSIPQELMFVASRLLYSFFRFRFHWVQVSNTQASLQPGSDVKFISDPVPLLCIQSNINLPSNIMISSDHSPSNILQSVSKRLCESLLSSVVLVGNKIPKDLDPIEKLVTKGGGNTTLVLNVQMLNRMV